MYFKYKFKCIVIYNDPGIIGLSLYKDTDDQLKPSFTLPPR